MPEPFDTPPRRILLVDCDAFYVQVARLTDPEGAGQASLLIVGGSPTGRGVVTSASYEARAFGVHSAMPTAQALRLCPQATVVPVPRGACVERSRAVRVVLKELAPVVQAASIDEFYLDLSGTERLFHGESLRATAERIREEVVCRTQISVSIGGGTRRIIAKLATRRAKPAGVHIVEPGMEGAFLATLDLAALPGVGPALVEVLRKRGLVRVEDALGVQLEWLQKWLGKNRGAWLYRRIRGLDDSEVDPREARKSISSERTFFQDIVDHEELEERLLDISGSVAYTLRQKGLRARTITVKLRDHDFRTRVHSRTVPEPIESDAAIHEVALDLLRDLRAGRRAPARLLGVGLSGLAGVTEAEQLGLFREAAAGESERDRRVSHAVDSLRRRFGEDAVLPGRIVDHHRRRRADSEGEEP
ncbi:MAG: DNA polymerase IV [Gemmatimonadetes bacterium]|nr:DNA polymerase IV [Gemmatimonadota bacterium]